MTEKSPQFPEYGDGGDEIGARRTRRAFRLCVAATIFFTLTLWVAEYFLSHDDAERLYISALTKPTESARALLQQAVKHDEASGESPNPRYVQALAEREEDDKILATYRKAYDLDRGNSALAIRFGCQLMREGKTDEARERFKESARLAPDNALPAYLEAAALALASDNDEGLRESLRLIARANSGRKEIRFPRPLWHAKLPQHGKRYTELQEAIVSETCTPLRNYTQFVMARASDAISKKRVQYWDSWLEMIQRVGQILVTRAGDSEAGAPPLGAGAAWQASEGIAMQKAAVERRQSVHELERGEPNAELIEHSVRLDSAGKSVQDFLFARPARASENELGFVFPVKLAFGQTLPVLILCYLFSYALAKILGSGRTSWTLPHASAGKWFLAVGAAGFLGLLLVMSALQRLAAPDLDWMPPLRNVWWIATVVWAGIGFVYPVLALTGVQQTAGVAATNGDRSSILRVARRRFRIAYVSMIRRYLGVAVGLFSCAACVWVITHRILFALYPWQFGLLASGFAEEELELVRQLASILPQ